MRRKLLSSAIMAATIFALSCNSSSLLTLENESMNNKTFDKYGGLRSKTIDSYDGSGYFRTHREDDGRWWLVTPDGNAFLSFGVNHFHSHLWTQDNNREVWEERFNGKANSQEWGDGYHNYAKEIFGYANFNTFGYHNYSQDERHLTSREKFAPYFAIYSPLRISHYLAPDKSLFIDIFSPAYAELCRKEALEYVAPNVEDKMIIGYAMADCPHFTENQARKRDAQGEDCQTFSRVIRNMGNQSEGKAKYVETMKSQHNDNIASFNKIYGTHFKSWSALQAAEDWYIAASVTDSEAELLDNNAFALLCVEQYYKVAREEFKKIDTNHLFVGDKIDGNVSREDEFKILIEGAKDYIDLVMIQCYGLADYQEDVHRRITDVVDLPIMNGDGGFYSTDNPDLPMPYPPRAESEQQRIEWIMEYAKSAYANPNYVGFNTCGVIDSHETGQAQKQGIVKFFGERYEGVFEAFVEIAANQYKYHGAE